MGKYDDIIYFNGLRYLTIKSTLYMGKKYLFVINSENIKDIKLLVCLNELIEVNDLELIKKILLKMDD